MDAGRLRRGDPRLIAALAYATVTGVATEPEALRAVGWKPTAAGLRHLRDELRAFLRAPSAVHAISIAAVSQPSEAAQGSGSTDGATSQGRQCLVLRRRRAWRSRASSTSSSISSG